MFDDDIDTWGLLCGEPQEQEGWYFTLIGFGLVLLMCLVIIYVRYS
jgi:hypothetical protein